MDILYYILIFIIVLVVILPKIRISRSNNIGFENRQRNLSNYTVPEKYKFFPTYDGTLRSLPQERNTYDYDRLTLLYEGTISENFLDKLYFEGFHKATDVRYDKDNTYIIVEGNGFVTKIAYHIKK